MRTGREDGLAGPRLWRAEDGAERIAVPDAASDKYSRGVLGVVTGSAEFPGAAVLGVEAACRTGVGMLRYLGERRAADLVLQRRPEVVTQAGRVQAWLIGSGVDAATRTADATRRMRAALGSGLPVVVDAGALDLLPEAAPGAPIVITPHHRELARTLAAAGTDADPAAIAAHPDRWAAHAARTLGVVVLLKGSTTHAATPDGDVIAVHGDCPWLATAGTGDVLAGILGALAATGAPRPDADPAAAQRTLQALAATAAGIHSLAAGRASRGGPITALDVAEAVPATIAALLAGRGAHPGAR